MPIWIICGQTLTLGGLEEIIVRDDGREGRKLCLGQHAVQSQGGRQLYRIIAARFPTPGEVHGQVNERLIDLYEQVVVRKVMGQVLQCPGVVSEPDRHP